MTDRRQRLRLVVGATVAALVGVLAPGGIARAHAIVESVVPADGSALVESPTQVVFTFSEPILADGMAVDMSSTGDGATPTATAHVDAADPTRVLVDVGSLPTGTYQVRLEVRDLEDLHEVVARTSFAVGEAAPAPSPPIVTGPEPMETAARWLFAAGLGLLIGVVAVRTRQRHLPLARPERLHLLAVAGGVLVLLGRIGVLLARAVALDGSPLHNVGTVMRTADAKRLVLVVVALGCVAVSELTERVVWLDVPVRMRHDLTCRQALGWIGVVNLAVLAAWGGHSALDGSLDVGTFVAKTGHLVGLGLWVGVLAVVLAVNAGRPSLRPALSAMSRTAIAGAFLTVVSGLLLASGLVVSITALLSTPYGLVLVGKVGLVAAAVLVGLVGHRSREGRWSYLELPVLAVVVLLGAGIATATPAIDPGFTDRVQEAPAAQPARQVDDLLLQARAIPGRPGVNTIELRVGETRRPNPGPVTDVVVQVGDDLFTTTPDATGLAYLEGVVLAGGETTMNATIHRAGWPDGQTSLIVAADPPVYVHQPVGSSARISGLLLGAAGVLSLVGIGFVMRERRRGQRPTESGRRPPNVPESGNTDAAPRESLKIS